MEIGACFRAMEEEMRELSEEMLTFWQGEVVVAYISVSHTGFAGEKVGLTAKFSVRHAGCCLCLKTLSGMSLLQPMNHKADLPRVSPPLAARHH